MKNLLLMLSIVIILFSCSKEKTQTENIIEFNITSDYYFVAVIDGEKIQFEYNIDDYGNGAVSGGGTTPKGYQYYDDSIFLKGISPVNSAGITILQTFSNYPDCEQITQIYHLGDYSYGKESLSTEENGEDGALVYYVDGNGVQWSSGILPANQIGSAFEIIEYENFSTFYSSKVITAKFSCTLYNTNGESKKLTNGELRGMCVSCGK
ncbi:MAG: hypothetical protein JXR61_04925 [Prolixibacteraceae bacterium]|nr:hypothetical protein [Prolixibacteraceae bacterium]